MLAYVSDTFRPPHKGLESVLTCKQGHLHAPHAGFHISSRSALIWQYATLAMQSSLIVLLQR